MRARTDTMADTELVIDRSFNAPIALVFRLWTDTDLLKRWFGPKDFTCPSFTLDFRVGGKYRGLIASPQYGDSWFGGTFTQIVPNQTIAMTFAWEDGSDPTEITITLSETDGITTQRFHQAPFKTLADRDSHLSGWTECLDKQAAYLSGHSFPSPALARLDALAGTWHTTITMLDSKGVAADEFSAIDIYRWMPGRHFLIHDVDANMDGTPVRSMEVIGLAPDGESYVTRNYDNAGKVSDYTAALDGLRWQIDGATERFRGAISADAKKLSGLWQRREGQDWLDWMLVTLDRQA